MKVSAVVMKFIACWGLYRIQLYLENSKCNGFQAWTNLLPKATDSFVVCVLCLLYSCSIAYPKNDFSESKHRLYQESWDLPACTVECSTLVGSALVGGVVLVLIINFL